VFTLFKVNGYSLYPLLKEDEVVCCVKIFSFTNIKVDEIVLFRYNSDYMIKKVTSISSNGYFVKGETPDSIDSRNFGELKRERLLYKVFFRFKPFSFF